RERSTPPLMEHANAPLCGALHELQPLVMSVVEPGSPDLRLFNGLLNRYHYLGHRTTVGENMRYLVRDGAGREVGCALFGSAAWKCAARDAWIGWDCGAREADLGLLTNNTRFLVLPWVEVPHLASHLLVCLTRRIGADWQSKYGHPLHALETFVDRDHFRGTCYQAANWVRLGATQGRTRNDRNHCIGASVKEAYLYALSKNFRRELGA
ncbi:MAG: Druantia anti-phage system protein DruA, partial [Chloroflexota bacterium]